MSAKIQNVPVKGLVMWVKLNEQVLIIVETEEECIGIHYTFSFCKCFIAKV